MRDQKNDIVNNHFIIRLQNKHANDEIGKVKAKRGAKHHYLGMLLFFLQQDKLEVGITEYVDEIIKEFKEPLYQYTKTPWNEKIFKVDT